YGNPNGHILQTRVGPGPPHGRASTSSLREGSGHYSGGPGPHEGSGTSRGVRDSSGGPEPQLLALERLLLPGHVATPDLPQWWNGSGLLSGEQDFGPQGSSCLDVVKDNFKALA